MMETRRLEMFVALIEAGSYRAAAKRLSVTQPALSQQVQRLERDIGAQLVNCALRPVGLTSAGREFYVLCERVLEKMR